MSDKEYSYTICPVCQGFSRSDMHVCPPLWDWRETTNFGDDEWQEVRARNEETAAEKAAELYDQDGDYYLIRNSGGNIIIMVRNQKTGEVTHWSCHGESLPHYYASKVT